MFQLKREMFLANITTKTHSKPKVVFVSLIQFACCLCANVLHSFFFALFTRMQFAAMCNNAESDRGTNNLSANRKSRDCNPAFEARPIAFFFFYLPFLRTHSLIALLQAQCERTCKCTALSFSEWNRMDIAMIIKVCLLTRAAILLAMHELHLLLLRHTNEHENE